MNEIIYLLQILIGILLWANTLTALGYVIQVAQIEPCPINHWLGKTVSYTVLFLIAFFIWPLRLLKVQR